MKTCYAPMCPSQHKEFPRESKQTNIIHMCNIWKERYPWHLHRVRATAIAPVRFLIWRRIIVKVKCPSNYARPTGCISSWSASWRSTFPFPRFDRKPWGLRNFNDTLPRKRTAVFPLVLLRTAWFLSSPLWIVFNLATSFRSMVRMCLSHTSEIRGFSSDAYA